MTLVIMEILNVLPDEIYDNHAFCNSPYYNSRMCLEIISHL